MPKVSVIVPVYNVEQYIEKCAHSLFKQTIDNAEYIFVDDASPDKSIDILYKVISLYPSMEDRISVIRHKYNCGLPQARKTGVSVASGDYIAFCDSDDWCEPGMYEELYNFAKENDLDYVSCDFFIENGTTDSWHQLVPDGADLVSLMLNSDMSVTVWSKLVKRSIAIDASVKYPIYQMGEDLALSIQYALLSRSHRHYDRCLYHYNRRNGSISNDVDRIGKLLGQFCGNLELVLNILDRKGLKRLYDDEISHRVLSLKNGYLGTISENDSYKRWKSLFSEYNFRILFSKKITYKERIIYLLTYLHLYPIMKKLCQ